MSTQLIEHGLEIKQIPSLDSPDLRGVHAVLAEVEKSSYAEAAEPFTYSEFLVGAEGNRWEEPAIFGAFRGAECVGAATVEFPLTDNLDNAFVQLAVPSRHRGQGIGSALFTVVAQRCRERGRSKALGWLVADYVLGADQPGDWLAGARFAEKRGITLRNVEVHRRLALPVENLLLDRLADEVSRRLGEYRIESWVGKVPEGYREQYGRLITQLLTDAPTGTLEMEPMEVDRARLEYMMDRRQRMGRATVVAVAIAPDGSLVGQSEIGVPLDQTREDCYQGNTLVFEGHRGHSLGLALKVAVHRELAAQFGWLTKCHTWNAEVNAHMIAINEKLGYEKVGRAFE
ncbi:MAG: GNAT family N-acetyltransferase, partial [Propionibacteriaceae bacterium]|nr:GNAT family N-acetyltransferase [Propionibacteriaceae bacterium]